MAMRAAKGRLQFHLATALVAVFVVGTLLGLNLIPRIGPIPRVSCDMHDMDRTWGWPFGWLYKSVNPGVWVIWEWELLVLDVIIDIGIFGLSVWGFERLYREFGRGRNNQQE